jgi:uncharacterized protein (TIGR03067 family)
MMRLPFAALVLFAAPVVADDAAAKKFLKDLEGSYTVTSMTRAGEAGSDEMVKIVTVTIKGNTLTAHFKKGDTGEDKTATVVVDPGQKPVAIDMTPKEGPDAGKPVLGIVKVEKDAVTLCWGDRAGTSERPKEFSSTKENKHFLIVLKRAG